MAALFILILSVREVQAQSCTFTIQNADFGNTNVGFNVYTYSVVRLRATCTGAANQSIRFCANLGAGTGGMDTSGTPRYLASGSNLLAFDIYPDNYTTVWGSELDTAPTVAAERFVNLDATGNGRTVVPIRMRIRYGQQTTPSGTYTTAFSGAESRINYGYTWQGSCASFISSNTRPVDIPFTATARVPGTCNVIDYPLVELGTQPAIMTGPLESSGTFRVSCPTGVPYTIALDGGSAEATDPTRRELQRTNATTNPIIYGLYSDAAYTQAWGSTTGVDTVSAAGAGSGNWVTYRVYVRVPQQPIPVAGFYQDAVAITLTY